MALERPLTTNSPLTLLIRVNLTQSWRRLLGVQKQSRLLTALIGCFIVSYLVLSFWLFFRGLKFVASFPGLGAVLTERLMYLLFASLFILLLLSNLVISYTNLFRNRESAFLMTMPVPSRTIFQWKFLESTLLASWAFLFLIAPLLVAFGLTREVDWTFYPVTIILIGLFIVLPGVAGSWFALNLAKYLDRRAFQIAAVVLALTTIALIAGWWRGNPISDDLNETRVLTVLDNLLQKTKFSQFPFLPSYWLSNSVIQLAEGAVSLAAFFALILLSNVMFFGFLAFTRFGDLFYDSASRVQSRASVWGRWGWFRESAKRRGAFGYGPGAGEKMARLLGWIDTDTRALLVKDARMFWRDTSQWGQTVLLFGLLAVYVMNVRHFTGQLVSPFWIHLVSYLNLGACSLNLATLTTRFVYPQFSLEGRRLWIVGMAPMGLAKVVKTKYWLASFASLTITLSLIVLSNYLLHMPMDRIIFFSSVIIVMTFTLNGLASGLGVLYPNFKEANPSKIVSGFGGTFCLVLSFVYILGAVLLLAGGSAEMRMQAPSQIGALLSVFSFALLSFLMGWIPFQMALKHLKNFEF